MNTMEKINESVVTSLRSLGFIPEEVEGFGYQFEYEGMTLAFPIPDDDTGSVTLIVPDVFDITDSNRIAVIEAMIRLCTRLKYVQPHIVRGNEVWLNYQHYVGETAPSTDVIEHMIRVLLYAFSTFHKILNENESQN